MTRGDVAKLTGVSQEAMRYYEERGLVHPRRSKRDWRVYDRDDVRRVQFILRAGELGFTLDEIGSLLAVRNARRKAQTLSDDVAEKIRDLRRMKRVLDTLVSGDGAGSCPILASLGKA